MNALAGSAYAYADSPMRVLLLAILVKHYSSLAAYFRVLYSAGWSGIAWQDRKV